jgi:hypothetical protein
MILNKHNRTPKKIAATVEYLALTDISPIIFSLLVNLIRGIKAKESCILYKMFRAESTVSKSLIKETQRAGKIAMDLVIVTLYQTGNLISRKPSITN